LGKEKRYYVYILASRSRILYVGMTGFLMARVLQHKSGETDGFTKRYSINRLVYYEPFRYVNKATARETLIKSGGAKRKSRSSRRTIPRGKIWPPIGVNQHF
jgi:putative endonuclease